MQNLHKENYNIFAGALASFIATSITHPLDIIRINQINSQSNLFNTLKNLAPDKHCLFKALYRGYILNTFAYTGTYGLFFPLNE